MLGWGAAASVPLMSLPASLTACCTGCWHCACRKICSTPAAQPRLRSKLQVKLHNVSLELPDSPWCEAYRAGQPLGTAAPVVDMADGVAGGRRCIMPPDC